MSVPTIMTTKWYHIEFKWLGDDGKVQLRYKKEEMALFQVEHMVENVLESGLYYGEFDDPEGRVHIPSHRILSVTVKRLPDEECTNAVENNGK